MTMDANKMMSCSSKCVNLLRDFLVEYTVDFEDKANEAYKVLNEFEEGLGQFKRKWVQYTGTGEEPQDIKNLDERTAFQIKMKNSETGMFTVYVNRRILKNWSIVSEYRIFN